MGSIFTGQKQAAIIGDSTAKLRLYRKLSKLIVLNMLNNINHYPFLTIYPYCAFSLLLAFIQQTYLQRLQASLNNYLAHHERLQAVADVAQTDLDELMVRPVPGQTVTTFSERLPKGIDELTLKKVLQVITVQTSTMSAEQVGDTIGASRTTARRYLEYLVGVDKIDVQIHYGSVGRPE
jgi:hypothetical protein